MSTLWTELDEKIFTDLKTRREEYQYEIRQELYAGLDTWFDRDDIQNIVENWDEIKQIVEKFLEANCGL